MFLNTAAKIKDYDQRLKNLRKHQTAAYTNQADNKSKALWRVIDNERKPKSSTDNQVHPQINGQIINEPCEIANCFNNYIFCNNSRKYTSNKQNMQTVHQDRPIMTNENFRTTSHNGGSKAIDTLNPKIFIWHQ